MIAEAYVQGVSQRDAARITEALTGQTVSKATASRVAKRLQLGLDELHAQKLEQSHPYLYLDATYVKARWAGKVESACLLVAYAVNEDGFRALLAVHIATSESYESWTEILNDLLRRGLHGVRLVISDADAALRKAVRHLFAEIPQQRCTVHLQRNIGAHIPKRIQTRVLKEVGKIFKAKTKAQALEKMKGFEQRWTKELPEAVKCLKAGFNNAAAFFEFPQAHHQRIHTTNTLERLNGEIKRRARAVGHFPDRQSVLRLLGTVAIQTTAIWADRRYLDISLMKEGCETEELAA